MQCWLVYALMCWEEGKMIWTPDVPATYTLPTWLTF